MHPHTGIALETFYTKRPLYIQSFGSSFVFFQAWLKLFRTQACCLWATMLILLGF